MQVTTREAIQVALSSMAFDYTTMSHGEERDLVKKAAELICSQYGLKMDDYFNEENSD